jgi:quercetin dioxygenase-like cupin family protein
MPEMASRKGSFVPAHKQELASLVEYQGGSVVSRALISRRAGTVTLFAFDEGEGLSEHTAPYEALAQVVEGKALVTVAGVPNEMEAGDAVLLPAGRPHSLQARTRFKMLLTMVRS